jgi:Tfp pilus assembly protein PilV
MIAMVFIMISMLAMLTAMITSVNVNLQNDLRNTAIRLTNQTAEVVLALPFTDTDLNDGTDHSRIPGDSSQNDKGFPPTTQTVRGSQQTYTIEWDVVSRTTDVKEVTITVTYMYKNKPYSNTGVTYKHSAI